ncbi:MAG: alpha/beta fold hydrolase [Cyclobacteriaceae bacterium]|nr:alpha/beta fold hydrolase [Cyclobacteriaceae bacterium]
MKNLLFNFMIPYRNTTFFIVLLFIYWQPLFSQNEIGSNVPIFIEQKSKVIEIEGQKIIQVIGYIAVQENRNNPYSKSIKIPVIIYKSTNPASLEPVFRLAGGPGESNIPKKVTNSELLKNHDFVFVGYRGVDGTTQLKSKKLAKSLKGINNQLLSDASLNNVEQAAKAYLVELKENGIDITAYTIMDVIEDLEYARKALSYDKINLLSGSYGTRVALLYSYKYPDVINRTVMNGANPPGHFLWYPEKTEEILDKWEEIYVTSGQGSVKEAMRVAIENMPEKWFLFKLDKDKIKTGTFVFLFSTDMAVMAFDAYFDAALKQDYSSLYAIQKAYDVFVPRNTWGDMFQKGFSADFDPETDYREYLRSFDKNTIIGANYALLLWGSSGTWQSKPISDEYRQLRPSGTETLILSGELDVSTPVDFTIDKLMPTLNNAHHIVLPNMSHSDVAGKQPDNFKKTINEFFLSGIVVNYYEPQTIDFKPKYKLSRVAKWSFPVLVFF